MTVAVELLSRSSNVTTALTTSPGWNGGQAQRWAGTTLLALLSSLAVSATLFIVATGFMCCLLATGRFAHV